VQARAYRTKPIARKEWDDLNFSQGKISGFDLRVYQEAEVLLIGGGAIGSHVALGMVRKGIKSLDILDDDKIELKNLTRQLYYPKNVGKNKAVCLAKILSKEGFFRSTVRGYPYRFQEALEMGMDLTHYHAIICAVDNNPTRVSATQYCLANHIPLVMNGVARDGTQMYCAVQEPDKACFGCLMPHALNDNQYPCNLPGIIDVIQVVSGFTVYALDTILTHRYREWNLRMISLDGSVPDSALSIAKKDNCPVCSQEVGDTWTRF
jgi:molybdopterin/thiamine biosynthesis adenylyltransferase